MWDSVRPSRRMIRALAVTHAETRLDATDSKPYVVFVVSVTGPERSWRVGRRFNQFANLYEWLEANLPQVASVLVSCTIVVRPALSPLASLSLSAPSPRFRPR